MRYVVMTLALLAACDGPVSGPGGGTQDLCGGSSPTPDCMCRSVERLLCDRWERCWPKGTIDGWRLDFTTNPPQPVTLTAGICRMILGYEPSGYVVAHPEHQMETLACFQGIDYEACMARARALTCADALQTFPDLLVECFQRDATLPRL